MCRSLISGIPLRCFNFGFQFPGHSSYPASATGSSPYPGGGGGPSPYPSAPTGGGAPYPGAGGAPPYAAPPTGGGAPAYGAPMGGAPQYPGNSKIFLTQLNQLLLFLWSSSVRI